MADVREIRFDNGAAYEQMMGRWSRLVGEKFLDWLSAPAGRAWIDIGCGNGAFTELLIEQAAPSAVAAVDPSEGQLAYARERPGCRMARFAIGDAMRLEHPDQSFDVASMALVLFFVPEPAKGVAEMRRVVRPGGLVAAYVWDPRAGFPYQIIWDELQALGVATARPPSFDIARMETLKRLWTDAGFAAVESREFVVERTYPSFESYWEGLKALNSSDQIAALDETSRAELRRRLVDRLPCDAAGRIRYSAKANAVKGRVPA
ncbi:MAG: class I SAM-dependent methyltransferase [Proteobacteria bacterium]|nr:class I SAM-dependent methyltransferase [Pseudomonadota bacterium]